MTPAPSSPSSQEPRLESWKEIANYLNRDARTVRRWEQSEGLPVHRHRHLARSSVYAFPSEVDAWRANRKPEARYSPPPILRGWSRAFVAACALMLALSTAGSGRLDGFDLSADHAGPSDRVAWMMPNHLVSYGKVSPNGRYVPFTEFGPGLGVKRIDPNTKGNNLFIHDLVTNRDRRLTDGQANGDTALAVAFSRNSKQLAYDWVDDKKHHTLRLIAIAGAEVPRPSILLDAEDLDYIVPADWTPDGQWIAAQIRRRDRTMQLVLVSTHDGTLRVLKSETWRGDSAAALSPDGRYLAYEVPGEATTARNIYVLATDGSRQIDAATYRGDDALVGWSANNDLVFISEAGGAPGLWTRRFDGHNFTDPAVQLRSAISADVFPMGIASDGTLFVTRFGGTSTDLYTASIDWATGAITGPPSEAVGEFLGLNGGPSWSPDGSELAFMSRRLTLDGAPRNKLVIRASAKPGLRDVETGLKRHGTLRWSPDGRSMIVEGTDVNDRSGIFMIDAASGTTTLVVGETPSDSYNGPRWSADSKRLYLNHGPFFAGTLVEWDLATRHETVLFPHRNNSYPTIATDGTKIYFVAEPSARGADGRAPAGDYRLMERTVATGVERELARRPAPYGFYPSPDGKLFAITGKDVEAFKKDPRSLIGVLGVVSPSGGAIRVIQSGCPEGMVGVGAWAPDSASILVRCGSGLRAAALAHFWVPLDGRAPRRLSELSRANGQFAANPKTGEIAFSVESGPSRPHEIHVLTNVLTLERR